MSFDHRRESQMSNSQIMKRNSHSSYYMQSSLNKSLPQTRSVPSLAPKSSQDHKKYIISRTYNKLFEIRSKITMQGILYFRSSS